MDSSSQLYESDFTYKLLSQTLQHNDVKIVRSKITPLPDKRSDNFEEYYKIEIAYENLKTSSLHVLNYDIKHLDNDRYKVVKSFDREQFFYCYLQNECNSLQLDVSFSPRCYLSEPHIFCFEDVSSRGFIRKSGHRFFDLKHCQIALKSLARFHCNTIILEKTIEYCGGHNLKRAFPGIFQYDNDNVFKLWFNYSFEEIQIISEIIYQRKTNLALKLEQFLEDGATILEELKDTFKCTVLHGDLQSANILFEYKKGKPKNCVLVNYHLLKYGPPALDVLHLIFSNTHRAFRDKHLKNLIKFYNRCVVAQLSVYKLKKCVNIQEPFTICETFAIFFLLQGICDKCSLFMPDISKPLLDLFSKNVFKIVLNKRIEDLKRRYNEERIFRESLLVDMANLEYIMS